MYSEIMTLLVGRDEERHHSVDQCLVCATGSAIRVPLNPIPVSSPFDCVGVDIIQFQAWELLLIDYLTKWLEAFALPDQSSATVAKLLVEEIVSRHGMLSEILSDCGQTFLSGLMKAVALLLGFHKINTKAYHPLVWSPDPSIHAHTRTRLTACASGKEGSGQTGSLSFFFFFYFVTSTEGEYPV